MPVYAYKCEDCKKVFEVRHGMFFDSQRCIECHSEFVFRIPSTVSIPPTGEAEDAKKPVGKVVDEYIEETKQEIKKEKKKLKTRNL